VTEQDTLETLDAIEKFAQGELSDTDHIALLDLLKKLVDAGLVAAMSITLRAKTGDLIREDSR